MNETLIIEYVELCALLSALDVEAEQRLYARLDQLWYTELTSEDQVEVEKRLAALGDKDRAWHASRHAENV